jgi:amidohydrolase
MLVKEYDDELVAVRREVHAHPELGRAEVRTTRLVRERLESAGLTPRILPAGTGLFCDVGAGERTVAIRADIDALPVRDAKDVAYRSTIEGVCHACGHDVHLAAVLGAGLVLADLHGESALPGRVRLIFQPAEELTPGGSLDVIAAGGVEGVERIFALHCDPRIDVGKIGVRTGPITAAADQVIVRVHGPGGHTSRPHLTADLVHALGHVITELPTVLSRRVDPRTGMSIVWGRVSAGTVANAIPQVGEVAGTLRCLEAEAWLAAPELVAELIPSIVAPYGVVAEVEHRRGVPPVVNDPASARLLGAGARATEGRSGVVSTQQSLGGEDFAWFLKSVPGCLGRLGVACPGDPVVRDLHQGGFDVDERAIAIGARVLASTALLALTEPEGFR